MSAVPWQTPPQFQTSMPLSYADIMLLRQNAMTLDSMSLKGRDAWTDMAYEFGPTQHNPMSVCRASFQFRTGLTTLTIVAYGTNTSSDTFKTYLNGVLRSTVSTTGADQTITITLTGLGFTDKQIVEVEIIAERASQAVVPTYSIRDAYVSPASGIVGSSPGAPSFGAISAANLQQLADFEQWLFDRMNAVSMPLFQGQLYRPLNIHVSSTLLWRGSLARGNGAARLSCVLGYVNTNTPSERVALSISTGAAYTEVATTPTITAGQVGAHTFDVDLSAYSDAQRLHIRLDQIVNTAFAGEQGALPTRWSLRQMETTNNGWTFATPAAYSTPRESLTFSALQGRLNSIVSCLSTVASRISGSADTWDRIRLYRQNPVVSDYHRSFFKLVLLTRSRRATDGLWLRGKGITIGYGALTAKPELESGQVVWEPERSEQVIGGDVIEDKFIGLDMLPGMPGGTLYYVYGEDLRYAAEVWQ
jgi:hypothetical protein